MGWHSDLAIQNVAVSENNIAADPAQELFFFSLLLVCMLTSAELPSSLLGSLWRGACVIFFFLKEKEIHNKYLCRSAPRLLWFCHLACSLHSRPIGDVNRTRHRCRHDVTSINFSLAPIMNFNPEGNNVSCLSDFFILFFLATFPIVRARLPTKQREGGGGQQRSTATQPNAVK